MNRKITYKKRPGVTGNTAQECYLQKLGVESTDEINAWYRASYAGEYWIRDLDKAVALALTFKNRKIRVFCDYDVDGVGAGSILYLGLKMAGFRYCRDNGPMKVVRPPFRHEEGYTVSVPAIEEFARECGGNGLMITVDIGIAAVEAVSRAKELGLTVIILDHHLYRVDYEGNPVLPPADVIIDPSAIKGQGRWSSYCGGALAYRFICAMIGKQKAQILLSYSALTTVADVMPLKEENRVFVSQGIKCMEKRLIMPGLQALINVFTAKKLEKRSGTEDPEARRAEAKKQAEEMENRISEYEIGFQLAPALNAPGRLLNQGAYKSINLLTCEDYEEAYPLAEELWEINQERIRLVNEASEKAEEMVREKHLDRFPVLMTVLQDVNPGIAGIIAGRLTEEHNRPSIVLTPKMGREGVLVGSCRSVPEINIKALLDEISDLMMAYGGHAGAAGLTLEKAAVPAFFQALIRAEKEMFAYVPADVDIRFYDLSADTGMCGSLAAEEKRFMPYGEGCEQNIYRITGYIPDTDLFTGKRVSVFGKDNKVYKMTCRGVSAITFDPELGEALEVTEGELVLYGTLSQNEYKGNIRPQITVEWFEKA